MVLLNIDIEIYTATTVSSMSLLDNEYLSLVVEHDEAGP